MIVMVLRKYLFGYQALVVWYGLKLTRTLLSDSPYADQGIPAKSFISFPVLSPNADTLQVYLRKIRWKKKGTNHCENELSGALLDSLYIIVFNFHNNPMGQILFLFYS